MDSISISITNTRVIDGLIFAANSAGMTPEAYAEFVLTQDGKRFAAANKYGVITSAAFFAKFTPDEYSAALAKAADTVEVPEAVGGVPTEEQQQAYDEAVQAYGAIVEPTAEETATYEAAVAAYTAASTPDNQAEIEAAEARNAEAASVQALLNQLTAEERVVLDDERVTDGLALLVSLNLLGAGRPAEITAYDRPFAVATEAPVEGGV